MLVSDELKFFCNTTFFSGFSSQPCWLHSESDGFPSVLGTSGGRHVGVELTKMVLKKAPNFL
jgi:hypothetical protein